MPMALPRPGAACRLTNAHCPEACAYPSAMPMAGASCNARTYRRSCSAAKASINGSSVVPGLPNSIRTPSCFNNSRSALFPGIIGIDSFPPSNGNRCCSATRHRAANQADAGSKGRESLSMSGLSRRIVLGGFAAAPLSAPAIIKAQTSSKPVKIGLLSDMGGPYVDVGGPGNKVATQLAIDDMGGSVLGRPIQILQADDQNKPDVST